MDAMFQVLPYRTSRFLQSIIQRSFLVGLVCCIPTVFVLRLTWNDPNVHDKFVRRWLVARVFLYIAQIPFRLRVLLRLREATERHRTRDDAVNHLVALCRSRLWWLNHNMGLVIYAWSSSAMVLVWLTWSRRGATVSLLLAVLALHLVVFLALLVMNFLWFRRSLDLDLVGLPAGPSPAEIARWTQLVDFDPSVPAFEDNEKCTICYGSFKETSDGGPAEPLSVRLLPCSHAYHAECIDQWLRRSMRCPLCNHAVNEPPPDHAASTDAKAREFGDDLASTTHSAADSGSVRSASSLAGESVRRRRPREAD